MLEQCNSHTAVPANVGQYQSYRSILPHSRVAMRYKYRWRCPYADLPFTLSRYVFLTPDDKEGTQVDTLVTFFALFAHPHRKLRAGLFCLSGVGSGAVGFIFALEPPSPPPSTLSVAATVICSSGGGIRSKKGGRDDGDRRGIRRRKEQVFLNQESSHGCGPQDLRGGLDGLGQRKRQVAQGMSGSEIYGTKIHRIYLSLPTFVSPSDEVLTR